MVVGSTAWRQAHAHELLDFALGSVCPEGGFGWLGDDGQIDRRQDRELWINCRMTYVAALGVLLGHPGCADALDHGVTALASLFRDQQYSGWYAAVGWDGQPSDTAKTAYPHACVILAAAGAVVAGADGGPALLEDALVVAGTRFWDQTHSMVVEEWDRSFTHLGAYRGANANMHWVEALLAAADALEWRQPGDARVQELRLRALAITTRLINHQARANDWRIPEHYDAAWQALPEHNQDRPADPFRPYGATIGHGLEWSRLCLQLQAALADHPVWLGEAAQGLRERAVSDGWSVDGNPGFVYTTDWQGQPVFTRRMHWVVAEAIGAAAAAQRAGTVVPETGQAAGQAAGATDLASQIQTWWDYADTSLIDHQHGSWHHELDPQNRPSAEVWTGKPDVYHALQATLFQDLPLSPGLIVALATREG